MSGKEMKFEKVLSIKAAADFLRGLAQEIEHGDVEQMKEFDLSFDDFKKMKIGIKRQGDQVHLKGKVKIGVTEAGCGTECGGEGEGEGKPSYKTLKKRMDKTFKAMGAVLKKDVMPEKAEVASFVADSELMVGYSGNGDEHYDAYTKLCVQLNVACENSDIEAVKAKYAELKAMKKTCHDQYK